MQDMNGFQVYREIIKRDINAKICFLTASESIFDIAYKFSSVYTFIRKPIHNNDLIGIINGLLNN
jgi:DNA-binding NtrC family response regulator